MSFFPSVGGGDFTPIFRLLDDYDTHRTGGTRSRSVHSFQPKFDVREVKDAYQLHGELPGIAQKDINIEFTDPTTLVVKGHIEREYHSGSPNDDNAGRITAADDDKQKGHKATVEDDPSEKNDDHNKQVQTQHGSKQVTNQTHAGSKAKYWVTERSVGDFQRSFTFPTRVDQDNVKASLKDGILNITIPKAAAHQSKKITIE